MLHPQRAICEHSAQMFSLLLEHGGPRDVIRDELDHEASMALWPSAPPSASAFRAVVPPLSQRGT